MIDAVWTVGHHPSLCGTEKFGHLLAKKLGVPVLERHQVRAGDYPIVSVRASEVQQWGAPPPKFDLFLHDWYSYDGGALAWLRQATRVFAANVDIARELRPLRPDVIEAFAPSTIQGNPTRGTINVLTFGMAHKLGIHRERYVKLKALLDDAPTDYTVSVSTAIHEGSPWDETAKVGDQLRAIFGSHLRVLGYLADDALARELATCSAVAIFFDPAVRANNTTFWAAMKSGKPVISNFDADSPKCGGFPCDIERLAKWPGEQTERWSQWANMHDSVQSYGWANLLWLLTEYEPCARCQAPITSENPILTSSHYGCKRCQGKRPELLKTLGQEDEAHLNSKAESG